MSSATETTTRSGRGKPRTSKSVYRSMKPGLQFPVGRVAGFLNKGRYAQLVGSGFPMYLSSVLEYLASQPRYDGSHILNRFYGDAKPAAIVIVQAGMFIAVIVFGGFD